MVFTHRSFRRQMFLTLVLMMGVATVTALRKTPAQADPIEPLACPVSLLLPAFGACFGNGSVTIALSVPECTPPLQDDRWHVVGAIHFCNEVSDVVSVLSGPNDRIDFAHMTTTDNIHFVVNFPCNTILPTHISCFWAGGYTNNVSLAMAKVCCDDCAG